MSECFNWQPEHGLLRDVGECLQIEQETSCSAISLHVGYCPAQLYYQQQKHVKFTHA